MVLFESSWSLALAIALSIYGALIWFGKSHLSDQSKDEMSLWLLGAYDDTWQLHFGRFFDAIFGEKHFSVTCFFRSSIASLLSVFILYLVLAEQPGVFGIRMLDNVHVVEVLVIATVVNLVPDYLSLFETRLLLRIFETQRSLFFQTLVLLVDLIITGIIIFIFITTYRYLTDQRMLELVEMLGFFSIYSIFFYSTFLTSIWAWLFVLSASTLRLIRRLRAERFLDFWGNAPAQIALFVSGYSFIIMLALAPIVERDTTLQATAFDKWLCDIAPNAACPMILRLSEDEQESLLIRVKLCEGGAAESCFASGTSYYDAGEFQRSQELYQKGCQAEGAESCWMSALILDQNLPQVKIDHFEVAQRGCILGSGNSCALSGTLALRESTHSTRDNDALEYFEMGCRLLSLDSCVFEAWMMEQGRSVGQDLGLAYATYQDACDQENVNGCLLLARYVELGYSSPPDFVRAKEYLSRACELGSTMACVSEREWNLESEAVEVDTVDWRSPWEVCDQDAADECVALGLEYRDGVSRRRNPVLAAKYFMAACAKDHAWACFHLGRSYQMGNGVVLSKRIALENFQISCELGLEEACAEEHYLSEIDKSFFLNSISRSHMEVLIDACVRGADRSCLTLSRFENSNFLDMQDIFPDTVCQRLGFTNCHDFFAEGSRTTY